jgi:CubicO group peptidase (beta-lactamase class C family)
MASPLEETLRSERVAGLHGLVVIRAGEVVVEHYATGEDFAWDRALGTVRFDRQVIHDIRSVTKSVVGLLYGIALGEGLVPPPEAPLLPAFPDYADVADADPGKNELLVEHALTMSLGLEWNEDVPYTSEANSEIAMELAPDRYRYVLGRPIVEPPGTTWHYCGGASALLGRLIERGSGTTLPDFARARLFDPLQIERFEWMTGDDGVAAPASGLRLTPRDLARIGQLVLGGGRWNATELIPRWWLEDALSPHLRIDDGLEYGYQWYLGSFSAGANAAPTRWVGGMGNGGQRLYVVPAADLVVAIAAGDYDGEDQSVVPDAVMGGVLETLG